MSRLLLKHNFLATVGFACEPSAHNAAVARLSRTETRVGISWPPILWSELSGDRGPSMVRMQRTLCDFTVGDPFGFVMNYRPGCEKSTRLRDALHPASRTGPSKTRRPRKQFADNKVLVHSQKLALWQREDRRTFCFRMACGHAISSRLPSATSHLLPYP